MINEIEEYDLTYSDIEDQIKDYKLEFLQVRRNDIEYRLKFPIFATSFYKIVKEYNQIPTQSFFYDYYLDENSEDSVISSLDKSQLEGLRGRIYRSYPSFVRDIHFSNMLYEETDFDEVIYNTYLDIKKGTDVLIINDGIEYGLNLYVSTKRSIEARKKKRKKNNNDYYEIDLPMKFKGSKQVGNFYLYSEKDIKKIESLM